MSRLVLGIAFFCLFAGEVFAVGFHIPPLPDFELQRGYGESPRADCDAGAACASPASKTAPAPHRRYKPPSAGAGQP
jgi:hypothetical protein